MVRFVKSDVFPLGSPWRLVCDWLDWSETRRKGLIMDVIRTRIVAPPPTPESIARAKEAMHAEREYWGFCRECDPAQILDKWGCCPNPFCLESAFAKAPSMIGDPRR
jgi:hypothetical protein